MNAKQELLEILEGKSSIICADIYFEGVNIQLKLNYSKEDFNTFLDKLDFEYDNGWGSHELYGTVWLYDNTWLSRGEYDGSEWWNHNKLPEIPENLK